MTSNLWDDERITQHDESDLWDDDSAASFLARFGNLRVPCSRYGYDTESCIPVAIRLANIIADASGEPLAAELLEHAMSLVVNNHEDVSTVLTEHGGTPEDYELAAYECSICGDQHGESAHGEPLVMRELHFRPLVDTVAIATEDARALIEGRGLDVRLNYLERDWTEATDDERDELASEYLDDIDAILADAGYYPVTDGDQGTWAVYAPVPEPAPLTT